MDAKSGHRIFSIGMYVVFGIAVTLVLFSLFSCGKSASIDTSGTNINAESQISEQTPSAQTQTTAWNPDGILSNGEYSRINSYAGGDYEIRWRTDGESIYIGIRARTAGWIAVGFYPTARMKDVDMVIGYVTDGRAVISDQFSTGDFGPHQADTVLGGKENISLGGGREEGGFTVIEFKRLVNTGDNFDASLAHGSIPIIWSYGADDNTSIHHLNRGYGEIIL